MFFIIFHDKKILFVFLVVLIILGGFLVFIVSDFDSSNQIKYKSVDIGGYNFNIPEELKLESEDNAKSSYGKIFSNDRISLAIIIRKDINLSEEGLLKEYNVSNYTNVKFGDLKGFKTEKYTSVAYYFKINNDFVLISFLGAKNTDTLVENMLKNISEGNK